MIELWTVVHKIVSPEAKDVLVAFLISDPWETFISASPKIAAWFDDGEVNSLGWPNVIPECFCHNPASFVTFQL